MAQPPDPAPANRRRALVSLVIAETTSNLGNRMAVLAIPWLVLVTTGSVTKMGLVGAASALAFVLFSVFGTPLIDWVGPRRMAVLADAGGAVATFVIAAGHRGGIWLLVAMIALTGGLTGLGIRAKRVLLPSVVAAAGTPMARVTALYDGLGRTATIVGGSLGGVLIAWLGPLGAIWVDAFSFAICAALIATMVRVPTPAAVPSTAAPTSAAPTSAAPTSAAAAAPGREPYFTALRAGFAHLRTQPVLRALVTMMFFTNIFNQASTAVLLPLWAHDLMHSPIALGLVGTAFAGGAILGNVTLAVFATRLRRYPLLVAGYLLGGAPRFLILAFSDRLSVVLAVTFLSGIAISTINPIYGVLLYERVPPRLQARTFGVTGAITFGGTPLGGLIGAWAVSGLGIRGGIVLSGLLYFAATLSPIVRYRTWRQMDDPPPEQADGEPAPAGRSTPAGDSLTPAAEQVEPGQGSPAEQGEPGGLGSPAESGSPVEPVEPGGRVRFAS